MKLRSPALVMVAVIVASLAFAGDKKAPTGPAKMDEQTRLQLIRSISSEIVYMRRPLPMGKKGVILKDGAISPSEREIQDMIAMYGPAVKAGDQARITKIDFKGDNKIIFEINGGPQKNKKWYQRITVGGSSGSVPLDPSQDDSLNARGSMVTLEFDKYVPEIGPQELKKLLSPVFNFDAKSPVEAYLDTVPPKVKEAIKNKQVLVGMDREMVMYALGRPPKKYRQDNYEEWIYGTPPDPVQFVRFVGDEVVRLEIMKVDGEKVVRTAKEIDLKALQPPASGGETQASAGTPAAGQQGPQKPPTLRRPGEAAPESSPAGNPAPLPRDPQRGPWDPPLSPTSGPGAAPPPPGTSPGGIPPN
jgi:hypothetical protein